MIEQKEKTKTIPPRYIYTYNKYIEVSRLASQQGKRFSRYYTNDFINEIVNSLANGLDIKNVDPILYPIILTPLETKKDECLFGANQNISAAKTISKAIDQIHRYFINQEKERKRLEATAKKKQDQIPEKTKNFTRKDIHKAVSIILDYEEDKSNVKLIQQIDPEIHNFLIDELRALKSEALLRKNFKMAEKYENSARTVILLKSENKYNEITNSHAAELQQKYRLAINDYKKTQLSWQQKINMLNQQLEKQIKKIQDETDQILIEFDKQFIFIPASSHPNEISKSNSFANSSTQATPRQTPQLKETQTKSNSKLNHAYSNPESDKEDLFYSKFKPSARLLELRKIERSLSISKRFDEANKIKRENDKLESLEKTEFVNRYNSDLEKKRKEIIKKQQNAIDIAYQKGQEKITLAHKQMNDQLNQAELVLRHLEESVNEANKIASFSCLSNKDEISFDEPKNNSNSNEISYQMSPQKNESDSNKKFDRQVNTARAPKREITVSKSTVLPHLNLPRKPDNIKSVKSADQLKMHPLNPAGFGQMPRMRPIQQCRTSRDRPNCAQLEQNLFYKRRMINNIMYSKSSKQHNVNKTVRLMQ